MPRAIDHLVIPARDLTALADLYRRLGFQVGARNRHPWGTENHIVQFDGVFLELIGLGEGFQRPARAAGVFSFAGFVAEYLDRREGLAMLVLRSADAEADRKIFAAEGLGDFERFDFARKATRPDGTQVDVAFSLAFAASERWPHTGFFVCQNRFPENFWSREARVHPNGAVGVAGLGFAHAHPGEAAAFLERFLGAPARADGEGGVTMAIDGASVRVATSPSLAARHGAENPGAELSVVRIGVVDIEATRRLLTSNQVAFRPHGDGLVVGADAAAGAVIVFEPAG